MKDSRRCATCCAAGTRSLPGRRARGSRACSTPSSRASSCGSVRSARNGGPGNTRPPPPSSCRSRASATSSIRPASAKSAPGASIPTSWAPVFRNFARISISVASTTAATWLSPAVPCAARRLAPSIPIGWCPTSGSMKKSASLPGPAAGVAGGDFGHHLREGVVEIDVLRVGHANHDEDDVRQLHWNRAGRFVRLLRLRAELVIDFACQLADFFGQARHVRERREIPLLELADPLIHRLLRLTKAHD